MFIEFFYYFKQKLNISSLEFLTLIRALDKGLIQNMIDLYYVSRSLFCKNESYFDLFDENFSLFFKGYRGSPVRFSEGAKQEIKNWLEQDIQKEDIEKLPESCKEIISNCNTDEIEAKIEHLVNHFKIDTGPKEWIGLDGKKLSIAEGYSESIGETSMDRGLGGFETAIGIADRRVFTNYRKDLILGVQQFRMALNRLRRLDEIGKRSELNLKKTIKKSCKNGGDIEMVFEKRRKNNIKIVLLLDVGGTMTPYAELVNKLFTAAHKMSHWKDFKYYYFHNCVYQLVFNNALRKEEESIHFDDFLRIFDDSYRLIVIGDAYMANSELSRKNMARNDNKNPEPGIHYINELVRHFKKNIIWLNPELVRMPWFVQTRKIIAAQVPMFNLTVEGIINAMDYLRTNGKNMFTTLDYFAQYRKRWSQI